MEHGAGLAVGVLEVARVHAQGFGFGGGLREHGGTGFGHLMDVGLGDGEGVGEFGGDLDGHEVVRGEAGPLAEGGSYDLGRGSVGGFPEENDGASVLRGERVFFEVSGEEGGGSAELAFVELGEEAGVASGEEGAFGEVLESGIEIAMSRGIGIDQVGSVIFGDELESE